MQNKALKSHVQWMMQEDINKSECWALLSGIILAIWEELTCLYQVSQQVSHLP